MLNDRTNIILTGFMATGKSTVGKLLAGQLEYRFVDTDKLIEERCGQTVVEIFGQQGEPFFRKMEAEVTLELATMSSQVIATGGGLLLNKKNEEVLGKNGLIFCLVAEPEMIMQRVYADKTVQRPLLEGPDPRQRIIELMQQRDGTYKRFRQIDTSDRDPQDIVDTILNEYYSHLGKNESSLVE